MRGFSILVVAALAVVAGCRDAGEQRAANQAGPAKVDANQAPTPPGPVIPRPEPPVDRAAILTAVFKARSAAATGADDKEEQAALDGREFRFRIRMGCALGAQGDDAALDPDGRRVELMARPDLTREHPIAASIAGDAFEAAEGFWIPDPWMLTPECVPAGGGAGQVGIAQFFTADEPRTSRRDGRPYRAHEAFDEASVPQPGSWDLVLSGRLVKIGDGRAIQCRRSPDMPPACIVSVRFDRVEIVNHRTGAQLADWRAG